MITMRLVQPAPSDEGTGSTAPLAGGAFQAASVHFEYATEIMLTRR